MKTYSTKITICRYAEFDSDEQAQEWAQNIESKFAEILNDEQNNAVITLNEFDVDDWAGEERRIDIHPRHIEPRRKRIRR